MTLSQPIHAVGPRDTAWRMPFIVGCGRSGTTLLAVMLDAHPSIAIPGESGFLLRICNQAPPPDGDVVDSFVHSVRGLRRFRAWGLTEEELRRGLGDLAPTTMPAALVGTYRLYAEKVGKPIAGDKTPVHVQLMPQLAANFPNAAFIHVIRDGRNVALATLDAPWGPTSVAESALYWRRRVNIGRRQGAALGSGRYMEVRYEDLLADPEVELRRVCKFLGVTYDSAMLDYKSASKRQITMTYERHAFRSLMLAPTKGLRDWPTQMAPVDVKTFETLAGGTLREFGYPRGPRASTRVKLRATVNVVCYLVSSPVLLGVRRTRRLAERKLRSWLLVDW